MYSLRILFFLFIPYISALSKVLTETISIPHAALQKSFKALVVLPEIYHTSTKRFPVIYLLHGYGGNYKSFSQVVNLEHYADSFSIIFVCPDGNYNSWYLDSPVKKQSAFKSYIINDVIANTDKLYRTIDSSKGRAVIGSSMGGHGALTLLSYHPDLFSGAGSISGILDLTHFPKEWDMADILGSYSGNKNIWEEHSFLYLMEKLIGKNKGIIIDCGTGDFALHVNRATHKKMKALQIKHEYYERPGGHSYQYVKKVFVYHIEYLARQMKNETPKQ